MIVVQDIKKYFGSIKAVDGIRFTIKPGEVVGFLGPNGAGKSTTMRVMTGFLAPDSGTVKIGEFDIQKDPVAAQARVGYLPESAALYDEMVVLDFLIFMGRLKGMTQTALKKRLRTVSEQCRIGNVLARKIGNLSKGYRQRVGLAQALLADPDILILDEPTVGLDPNQIGEIRELIKEIGATKTILLSTHILPEVAATCQRVLIIHQGKIVAQGTPESLSAPAQGRVTYRVTLRAELKALKEQMARLPHFDGVDVIKSDRDIHDVLVHCHGKDDLGEKIFDLAVANNWRLSQLVRQQQSLEEVFKELTQ